MQEHSVSGVISLPGLAVPGLVSMILLASLVLVGWTVLIYGGLAEL